MNRSWRWPLAGFAVGALAAATVLTVNVVGAAVQGAGPAQSAATAESSSAPDVLHRPPLLVAPDQALDLAYEVVCSLGEQECSPAGTLFARAVGEHAFAAVPLEPDAEGRLAASLPARYAAGDGLDYYAVVTDGRGSIVTAPPGGAAGPQHAWVVRDWTRVDLGTHVFGQTRAPDDALLRAAWGRGDTELGLDGGAEQATIGPSAFDLAPDGSVVVLDQVNRRLALYGRAAGQPRHLPIEFAGGIGDLAVASDGAFHVLDDGGPGAAAPIARTFAPDGTQVASTPLAQRTADMLRIGPGGPLVHGYPAELWLPTGKGRPPLSPAEQAAGARAARALPGGLELVVSASEREARLALVNGSRVTRSWLVTSATPLGEVQLAERFGTGLLAVLRVWTDERAEFVALPLTPSGVGRTFAIDTAEWAETSALSRFRLAQGSLYQLRSTPAGAEVVAFTIGGKA